MAIGDGSLRVDMEFYRNFNGEIIREIGGFIDPISPKIIIKEVEDEVNSN